jgi:hypothetical protein
MKLVQLRNHRENKQTVKKRQEQYSRATVSSRSDMLLSCPVRVSLCIASYLRILQYATLLKVPGVTSDRGIGNPKNMACSDSGDLKAVEVPHPHFRQDTTDGPAAVLAGWRTEDCGFRVSCQEKAPPSSSPDFQFERRGSVGREHVPRPREGFTFES